MVCLNSYVDPSTKPPVEKYVRHHPKKTTMEICYILRRPKLRIKLKFNNNLLHHSSPIYILNNCMLYFFISPPTCWDRDPQIWRVKILGAKWCRTCKMVFDWYHTIPPRGFGFWFSWHCWHTVGSVGSSWWCWLRTSPLPFDTTIYNFSGSRWMQLWCLIIVEFK